VVKLGLSLFNIKDQETLVKLSRGFQSEGIRRKV
jgi:hypothetical protein